MAKKPEDEAIDVDELIKAINSISLACGEDPLDAEDEAMIRGVFAMSDEQLEAEGGGEAQAELFRKRLLEKLAPNSTKN